MKNLLMITRKVDKDEAQAGFAYSWVKKFAQRVGRLKVICLEKGNLDGLPLNVELFSLGKEKGKNRLKEFINFQRGALKFIGKVEAVFCHMNPEYTILISPYVKLFNKKIISWYSHRAVNWRVRLMTLLTHRVATPTEESFGLKSKKKVIVGHGIDTDLFKPAGSDPHDGRTLKIISVGRISPIKNYETLIEAIDILDKRNLPLKAQIIGGLGLPSHQSYFDKLKQIIKKKGLESVVEFKGLIPNQKLPEYYQGSDLSVNLCPTGSPDKAVLEAMACGCPTIVCNKTFSNDFGPYREKLLFKEKDPDDLAQKIDNLIKSNQLEAIGKFLRERVFKHHNLDNLIEKLLYVFEKIS